MSRALAAADGALRLAVGAIADLRGPATRLPFLDRGDDLTLAHPAGTADAH
jgi:hypothetical protein